MLWHKVLEYNTVDNYQSLCLLMLMRLKTELSPFDRLRLHKAAMFVEVFSRSNCFKISDERCVFFPVVDNLSEQVRLYQTERKTDTANALKILHEEVSDRVKESYTKSIPYLLQSAGFVNSIADRDSLMAVSEVCGVLKRSGKVSIADTESLINDAECAINKKDLITIFVNLEKSGLVVKTDLGYNYADSFNDVAGYVRVL